MNQSIDVLVKKHFWWVFFLALIFALFSHLDYLPLKFEEPRRGVVALEMEMSGNYLTPTINGEYYYNKPPIYNWMLVGLFKVFNSYEDWVLRIPTVLSFLLIAFINYKVVRKKLGDQIAVLSSLFFITSTDLLFYFSFQGEIDMFYSLLVYLQIISILWFFEKENYKALFLLSYFLVAVGVLTKGIPSMAFQGITLLAFFIYNKRFKQLFNPWHFVGFGLFISIVGGYFYWYDQQNDAIPYMARLLTESTNRTVVEKSFFESIIHLFTFPLILLDILAPWLIIAPLFITKSILAKAKQSQWIGYIALFFVSNIIIYWISPGSRDRYLYMFVPFVTTLFAFVVGNYTQENTKIPKLANGLLIFLIGLFVLAMPILPFVPPVATVSGIYVVAAVLFILFAGLLFLYLKATTKKIFVFILFVVVARIGFNFIVMPLRLEDEHRDNYKLHVSNMLEIVGDQPFFLHSKIEHSEKNLPLSSTIIPYQELAYNPFQLTYYIEKGRKEIFKFSNEKRKGVFYLSEKAFFEAQPENKTAFYEFHLDKRGFDFVLFQYE